MEREPGATELPGGPPPGEDENSASGPRHPAAWVSTTYFAEGFPYAIVHSFVEVLFTELGASLKAIGLTSLLHLPWNLKFLWGPVLDAYGTKRTWIAGLEFALAACLAALAFSVLGEGNSLIIPTALFAVVAVLAATHDIAIDSHYLVGLDEDGQARWVGLRAPAYRVALLVVGGPGLVFAARLGFPVTFGLCAVLLAVLAVYHGRLLPSEERAVRPFSELARPGPLALVGILVGLGAFIAWAASPGPSRSFAQWMQDNLPGAWSVLSRLSVANAILILLLLGLLASLAALPLLRRRWAESDSFYAQAFLTFLDQPHVGRILWFILFFRTGESFLMRMKYPFLKSIGMSLEAYGWASGTVGMVAALVAPALGGWLIARDGLRRWIWPFVIAQNLLNLAYWGLATSFPEAGTLDSNGLIGVGAVITLEMFGAGLGTAVFMVYIMRVPLPDHKAAHTAILTALMSFGFLLAGVVSGFLAEWLGFGGYFLFTVAATVPGMLVIPFLPYLDGPRRE